MCRHQDSMCSCTETCWQPSQRWCLQCVLFYMNTLLNRSPSPPTLPLSTFRQCIVTGGCLPFHGLMVGFPRFASKGAVSIYELAASSGRFWMSQAHNLYLMNNTYMHTYIHTFNLHYIWSQKSTTETHCNINFTYLHARAYMHLAF